uniref:Uncharacterized protein n=1 Tax=Solanum tuberosum TaxID=4113 RepID=M1DUQ1_SOLTU
MLSLILHKVESHDKESQIVESDDDERTVARKA